MIEPSFLEFTENRKTIFMFITLINNWISYELSNPLDLAHFLLPTTTLHIFACQNVILPM